ncbi:MAG: glycosyltransferase family 4 protein [Sphingomonadales bacterium]|nr:glycosyltransferase family 4 protein [Sphingomonadales bacterium]
MQRVLERAAPVPVRERTAAAGSRNRPAVAAAREILIDVNRLIWRVWRGRLPTGIDRVCLAYLEHFGDRAQAVLQRNGQFYILSPEHSDRLFAMLRCRPDGFRREFVQLAASAWLTARRTAARPGLIYFNIGHTGLEDPGLPAWIRRNGIRAVYLIHDLIPLTHPEFCRADEAAKHARRIRNVLTSAFGVIGNSRSTIAELAAFAQAQELAMPPCVAAWISGYPVPDEVRPAALQTPYFVTVGTIEGRKNHVLLLQIWRRLAEALGPSTPKLLIIGQRGWEAEHALAMIDRAPALKGHVRELGFCDDHELARWIAGARALLMPSFAEGFGLPVIEALQLGTPVIASDLPVFREIAGKIPTYLDPLDGAAWQQTINGFLSDDPEHPERARQRLAMQGFEPPDWAGHFATVEAWLRSL